MSKVCCLDSKIICKHDFKMRTTVTIDPDTEILLKEEVKRTGKSFKRVLNESIRGALGTTPQRRIQVQPLFKAPFPKHLQNENFNQMADSLEDQDTLEELQPSLYPT